VRWFMGVLVWMLIVGAIITITDWGPDDPGYWGVILFGLPVSMVLSAFFPPRGNGK